MEKEVAAKVQFKKVRREGGSVVIALGDAIPRHWYVVRLTVLPDAAKRLLWSKRLLKCSESEAVVLCLEKVA